MKLKVYMGARVACLKRLRAKPIMGGIHRPALGPLAGCKGKAPQGVLGGPWKLQGFGLKKKCKMAAFEESELYTF